VKTYAKVTADHPAYAFGARWALRDLTTPRTVAFYATRGAALTALRTAKRIAARPTGGTFAPFACAGFVPVPGWM
jgi:hypothetical protein